MSIWPKPTPPKPAPKPDPVCTVAVVVTSNGQPVEGADVYLGNGQRALSNSDGYVAFNGVKLGVLSVHVGKLGYVPYDGNYGVDGNTTIPVGIDSLATTAGESGWLRREGKHLLDEQGREWRYRGFTDFALFRRYLDGADLSPILTERVNLGANTLRVLLTASALFDLRPEHFSDGQLDSFLDLLASYGLRCECVVLVDANPNPSLYPGVRAVFPTLAEQQAFVSRMASVFDRHWNVIGELGNECSHEINRVDRSAFTRPDGRNLWERGSGQADEVPYQPGWDLTGDHPGRVSEWPRRLNARDWRDTYPEPCIENEPMGASETDQPGRRSNNADDFAYFAALAAMNCNGACFHSDDGITSTLLGPIQTEAARAFFFSLRWVPTDAVNWPYRRGGLSGDAASCIKHDDALALRTFSKVSPGGMGWTVAIRPSADWRAVAVDGWRIVDEPRRGLVKLTR